MVVFGLVFRYMRCCAVAVRSKVCILFMVPTKYTGFKDSPPRLPNSLRAFFALRRLFFFIMISTYFVFLEYVFIYFVPLESTPETRVKQHHGPSWLLHNIHDTTAPQQFQDQTQAAHKPIVLVDL